MIFNLFTTKVFFCLILKQYLLKVTSAWKSGLINGRNWIQVKDKGQYNIASYKTIIFAPVTVKRLILVEKWRRKSVLNKSDVQKWSKNSMIFDADEIFYLLAQSLKIDRNFNLKRISKWFAANQSRRNAL